MSALPVTRYGQSNKRILNPPSRGRAAGIRAEGPAAATRPDPRCLRLDGRLLAESPAVRVFGQAGGGFTSARTTCLAAAGGTGSRSPASLRRFTIRAATTGSTTSPGRTSGSASARPHDGSGRPPRSRRLPAQLAFRPISVTAYAGCPARGIAVGSVGSPPGLALAQRRQVAASRSASRPAWGANIIDHLEEPQSCR